jgi:predicted nucleic acid-binding protein
MKIFVDTSGWVALFNRKDKYYSEAVKLWKTILKKKEEVYTTNYIIDETITLIRRRAGFQVSIKTGESLLNSKIIKKIIIKEEIEKLAFEIYKKFSDKEFSFTDCTSFETMERNKIDTAFSLDKNFTQYGFKVLP